MNPPYVRIVAEIHRQIAAGELRPGDRVPSTRVIASEWGVAIGTASHALSTLRADGVVRTIPRVGTVVAEPARRRGAAPRPTVEGEPSATGRSAVVAAIALADTEGLDALSMRGIAAQLGVPTMSLYRHVGNKEDLVMRMVDACFDELADVDTGSHDWRAGLEAVARGLWQLFWRHPWLPQVVTLARVQAVPGLFGYVDQVMRALRGTGADSDTKLRVHMTMFGYVAGIAAAHEQEARAEDATGLNVDEWMASREPDMESLMISGRYPEFAAVLDGIPGGDYVHDLHDLFEFGLRSMLDGVAAHLDDG